MTWSASALEQLDPGRKHRLQRVLAGAGTHAERLWLAPWRLMEDPDGWQRNVLTQLVTRNENAHILCSRGAGKSYVFAAAAYLEGALGGFAVIFSRSDEQALEVMRYVKAYHRQHDLAAVVKDNEHSYEFKHGGRILVRPYSGHTVIGKHGVTLLGIDEAARVSDEFFAVVTPMLTVSERVTGVKPRMALMSTPYGKRGFFWKIRRDWEQRLPQGRPWHFHRYDWRQCRRVNPADVEEYRREHGDFWYRQEYECEFLDNELSFFNVDDFRALGDVEYEFLGRPWGSWEDEHEQG